MSAGGYPGWRDVNLAELRGQKPRSKYRAQPTSVGNITFASQREANRYLVLLDEQQRGVISDLELQTQFPIAVTNPAGTRIVVARYLADFTYTKDGRRIVEDAKGMKTAVYSLKKALVEAQYGIQILET